MCKWDSVVFQILLLNLEPEVRASLGDSSRTLRSVENFTMYLGSADYVFRTADSNVSIQHFSWILQDFNEWSHSTKYLYKDKNKNWDITKINDFTT